MTGDRRGFLQILGGVSTALLSGAAAAEVDGARTASLEPLIKAGLDPFSVYCKMFASTANGAECAWWFMGALPIPVDDIGPVDTLQEETLRVNRAEVVGPNAINIRWREVGVFRDVASGEIPKETCNPVTGQRRPHTTVLKGGPALYSIRKNGQSFEVAQDTANIKIKYTAVDGKIIGERVGFIRFEEKSRTNGDGSTTNLLTIFKLYANLADLKGKDASVPATGYYGVRVMDTGNVFVNGLMQKAGLDEKINPVAWDRNKAAHPEFFKGDRIDPGWNT